MIRVLHAISTAAALMGVFVASSCASKNGPPRPPEHSPASVLEQRTGSTGTVEPAPSVDAAKISAMQNHRVAGLRAFAARGSAELRWHDEKGDHFEQAQVDLAWRKGGEEMSLRVEKLGERLAWAGASAARWWLFEPRREPSRLSVGARATPMPDSLIPFASPEALLELLAALPWPDSIVVIHQTAGTLTVEFDRAARGAWRRTRVELDSTNAFPTHVWLLNSTGAALADSELSEPVVAQMHHLPMAQRPLVASKITLKSKSNVGVWQIFWDEPGAREDRLRDRLFDFEVIRGVLLPAEVVDLEKGRS